MDNASNNYGYIYKTTIHTVLGDFYYWGQKKSNRVVEKYYGTSKRIRMYLKKVFDFEYIPWKGLTKEQAKQFGLDREIVAWVSSRDELDALEEFIVGLHLHREYCWNIKPGGQNPITYGNLGHPCSEEKKRKIAAKQIGKYISLETKRKMSESHKGQPSPKGMLGKHLSRETIEKALATKRANGTLKHKPETIEKIRLTKQNISDETRRRLSEGQKRRIHFKLTDEHKKKLSITHSGSKNPAYGRFWWNNGTEQRFVKECPGKDWVKGRLYKRK